jgi:hypothetical protein
MKMNTLWKKRAVRIGLVVLGVLAVTVALVAMYLSTLVRWSMTPSGRFDPSASPAAPDYADPASWSALPDRDEAGESVPVGARSVDQRTAPVDVFYMRLSTRDPAGTSDVSIGLRGELRSWSGIPVC